MIWMMIHQEISEKYTNPCEMDEPDQIICIMFPPDRKLALSLESCEEAIHHFDL